MVRLPMGFGKTICTLTAAVELIKAGELRRVLVLAPLRVCDLTWAKEPEKWSHIDLDVRMGTGSAHAATAALNSGAPIVVINYDVAKDALNACDRLVRDEFDGLVLDEITKLKTPGGAWHKAVNKYAKTFKWRVGLTGTLAEEGLEHLYGMYRLIDLGKAFGRRKDAFLRQYFYPTDYQNRNWAPFEGTSEKLARLVEGYTLDVTADDQGRPPLVVETVPVPIPDTARLVYAEMAEEMVVELDGEEITAKNAAVKSGKLQQIANGFLYDGDDVVYLHDAKTPVVKELAGRHPGGALIAYQYEEDLHRLQKLFPGAPVIGKGATREAAQAAVDAWNAGDVDVLLMHPMSGGHGLNMQYGGSTLIFYGPLWSRDQHDQIIARLWRRGQKAKEVRVYLVAAERTVEDCVIIPRQGDKKAGADLFADHLREAASR